MRARINPDAYPHGYEMKVAVQEFCKLCKPKINKLKGGYSATANLIFQLWLKDINIHVKDWNLTEREAIQLVKDFTAERAHNEVEFYMGMGQKRNESGDAFADDLQILVRKIIAHKPSFRAEANEQLKHRYAHKLHDQYYAAIACSALQTSNPAETFTQFCG